MLDRHFAILAAAVTLTGSGGYALDTLRGRTQPNRVSWALWALAPLIAFAAEVTEHVGLESLLTLAVGVGPLLVTIASFYDPHAYARLTRFDIVCGGLSLAALAMWGVTRHGDVAIAFSVLADLWAGIPTIQKALRRPQSESAKAFIGGAVGSAITLLTIPAGRWAFASFAFPLYILLIDIVMGSLVLRPRLRSRVRPRSR